MDNEEVYVNDLGCSDNSYPNLMELFSFLHGVTDQAVEVNLTAAHYFYQIVNSLINKSQIKTLSYIYSHRSILKILITRAEVPSFKQLLARILHFYKDDDKIDFGFKFLKYRFTLLKKIFISLIQLNESEYSTGDKDSLNAKERNLIELMTELLTNKDKIIDGEYFIDQIFFDKQNLNLLLEKTKSRKSPELLKFLGLCLQQLFGASNKSNKQKSQFDTNNLRQMDRFKIESDEDDDIELDLPDICRRKNNLDELEHVEETRDRKSARADALLILNLQDHEITETAQGQEEKRERKSAKSDALLISNFPILEAEDQNREETRERRSGYLGTHPIMSDLQSDEHEKSPDLIKKKYPKLNSMANNPRPEIIHEYDLEIEENENHKDNKSTAETSNGGVNNIELELYDEHEIKKTEISANVSSAVDWIIEDLFDEKIYLSIRSIATSLNKETRPSGSYKISILRFLSIIIKLNYLEDKFRDCLNSDFMEKLIELFPKNPTNNLIHYELSNLLDILVKMVFRYPSGPTRIELVNETINKLNSLVINFQSDSKKSFGQHHLYKSYLFKLCESIKTKLDDNLDLRPDLTQNSTRVIGFVNQENKILDNKVFSQHKISVPVSVEILPDNFELCDTKIDEIISRKKRHQATDDDDIFEMTAANYASIHAEHNNELLSDLIYDLRKSVEGREDEENYDETLADYEVNLDLDLPDISSSHDGKVIEKRDPYVKDKPAKKEPLFTNEFEPGLKFKHVKEETSN